eukprot:gnl/TRDRNA2_/TRDRNA2_81811_c0_seq2.p1 gnl/TRDRNA2_/TRDRNA2_81811_c0~~gnl/TRDRNA2_/TRDRNA2_81811_c0_seq2.p1  ORF type:complete len:260 (-),score=40.39 gnl/TRDRNA2_/TRDRNA2_81811_c0_seq2:10-744(-)
MDPQQQLVINTYNGGCEPIYGITRPVTETQSMDPSFVPIAPEADEEWIARVKGGGAGAAQETREQQLARYALESPVPNAQEIHPGRPEWIFRNADLLLTASLDYTIRTFIVSQNFKAAQIFEGHTNSVNCVEPYRNNMFLSASDDCTVRLWRIGTEEYGEIIQTMYAGMLPVKCVVPLPGHRIACGGVDKSFRIMSLVTGMTLHRLTDHEETGPDPVTGEMNGFFQEEGCGQIWCVLHLRGNWP